MAMKKTKKRGSLERVMLAQIKARAKDDKRTIRAWVKLIDVVKGALASHLPAGLSFVGSDGCVCNHEDPFGGRVETRGETQAVILHARFPPGLRGDMAYDLQSAMVAALDAADAGEADGWCDSSEGDDVDFYIYGPRAMAIYDVIKPVIAASRLLEAVARLRFGGIDASEVELEISTSGGEVSTP